ncbi:MAG: hypothetical protein IPH35_11770 [Rhodoferax sp.]|nr:hypothetical protein [Rhodoferax sp.]
MSQTSAPLSISLFDKRPFFEKALVYGVENGILTPTHLDAICADAPKGIVQIARYFGRPMLRPELEKAKDRMVNLVSLHLEDSSGGDLQQAAGLLRDHSFLSRSKAGSDMLKAMLAMPDHSHFGLQNSVGFSEEHIPLLDKWSLRSLAEYQNELARRQQIASVVKPAVWFAQVLGLDEEELVATDVEAEAVIRTGLLTLVCGRKQMPDWVTFEKMVLALRKKYAAKAGGAPSISLPKGIPEAFRGVVQTLHQSVLDDLPRILDNSLPVRKLFHGTPMFMGRYFWLEDALSEVNHFDSSASNAWNKLTDERNDDASLLTLFLCVAASSTPKTTLTESAAKTLVRKIQKSGLQPDLVEQFIAENAPALHCSDYTDLWRSFIEEARPTLLSDHAYALKDALALLRRECQIVP